MCIVLQILKGSFLFLQKRKRRERDDADAVSLCSFDFKVRKPAKQQSGRFGTTDLSKSTNQDVLFFKLLTEVSLSTKCLKTTKSDYNNIKKEKKMPPLPYLSAKIKAILHKMKSLVYGRNQSLLTVNWRNLILENLSTDKPKGHFSLNRKLSIITVSNYPHFSKGLIKTRCCVN